MLDVDRLREAIIENGDDFFSVSGILILASLNHIFQSIKPPFIQAPHYQTSFTLHFHKLRRPSLQPFPIAASKC